VRGTEEEITKARVPTAESASTPKEEAEASAVVATLPTDESVSTPLIAKLASMVGVMLPVEEVTDTDGGETLAAPNTDTGELT
jgi:hypothetical protein